MNENYDFRKYMKNVDLHNSKTSINILRAAYFKEDYKQNVPRGKLIVLRDAKLVFFSSLE